MTTEIRLVLDLDNYLVDGTTRNPLGAFYKTRGIIIDVPELSRHCVHPGACGFIQLALADRDIKLIFFSAGREERNIHLVAEIVKRSLPERLDFDKAMERIAIRSAEDMIDGKKQLRGVIPGSDDLSNVIFVDDSLENSAPGEEMCFLAVPPVNEDYYLLADDTCFSEEEIHLDTNAICFATGIIWRAIDLYRSRDKIPLHTTLSSYKNDPSQHILAHGCKLLQSVDPLYQPYRLGDYTKNLSSTPSFTLSPVRSKRSSRSSIQSEVPHETAEEC